MDKASTVWGERLRSECSHLGVDARARSEHFSEDVGLKKRGGFAFIPTLVLSEHFLPTRGGTISWLLETYTRYQTGEIVVVADEQSDTEGVDCSLPFAVERISMKMTDWDPTVPASTWRYVSMFEKVRRICRRYGSRQVHCMKVLPEGIVAWCLRRTISIPYVIYAHGEEILTGLTSRKLGWIISRLYRGASAIIANSGNTKQLLTSIGVHSDKIHVIHPGVDVSAFGGDEAAALSVRERYQLGLSPVLLTMGRLQRRKGQDMVIRSLPLVMREFPEVRYLVVGIGKEIDELRRLALDSGVGDRVTFVGQIDDQDRAAYYKACDLFVMPNREINGDIEGFGMVFLEAGAAGRPVIGGRSGGTGEAIVEGITGLRVDGEDIEQIAAAIIHLLSDPARARSMGDAAARRVRAEFSWDAVVDRTRSVASLVASCSSAKLR